MSTVQEPTQAVEKWLECRIDQGMFSDELAVTYPASGKWQKSVFVERSAVKGAAGTVGKVRVTVIPREGALLATLPSPERDIVYVNDEDISEE